MKKIKIGLVTGPIDSGHSLRGIGVHTQSLVTELEKRNDVEIGHIDFNSSTQTHTFDVVHYPSFNPYFQSFPFPPPKNSVLTIHDLIPLIYPNAYPPGLKARIKFRLQKFFLKQTPQIITISETSKKDIIRLLGIHPDKVNVIYLAPKAIFKKLKTISWKAVITKKYSLPKSFALYVGDLNYNKNIPQLAKACIDEKIHLAIAGKAAVATDIPNHIETEPMRDFISNYSSSPYIHRLGFVPDEDLVKVYNLALFYVQPSLYEGFGLPVVEAMACSVPTLISKTQALTEISNGASVIFESGDLKDLKQKLRLLAKSRQLRNKYSKLGLERSKDFSWEVTASQTIEVYKKVIRNANQ